MKKLLAILLAVMVVLVATMAWQHQRYANAQFQHVQDQQDSFYGAETFHVITFFMVADESKVLPRAAELVTALESSGAGKLIYVGQTAFSNGTTGLADTSWSGVAMMQYDSRSDYEMTHSSPEYQEVFGSFARTYSIGMDRPVAVNLFIRQMLLFVDIRNRLAGPSIDPLKPISDIDADERVLPLRTVEKRLRALAPVNDEALLVFNLSRAGTPEQQAADANYGGQMMARMARGAHGPLHVGSAVTLEGDPDFDNVILVYYPGPNYFADLLTSTFFVGIASDKQLGENLSMPTVPILRQIRQLQDIEA